MSLPIPTTESLNNQIISQLEGQLSQTIPILPKSFARVLAKVLAAVFVLLFKYAGFTFLQLFVAHASDRETTVNGRKLVPLTEWGRLVGVGDRNAATRAELWLTVTVLNQVGSLAAGQQLTRTESGFIYTVVAPVALNAATVSVRVRATAGPKGSDGSGVLGNLQAGDVLEFANTPAGVATRAVVASQAKTGADAETTDRYRARIFDRFQNRPQGGAYADYRQWAEDVEGIVRAYPYAGDPGEVDVYIEADEASSGSPDGIATGAQVDAVKAAIELNEAGIATRRPVSAAVNVYPITRTGFALEVSGLDPSTSTIQDAIIEGVDEHLRSREPFIVGLSANPRKDRITQAAVAGLVVSIAEANGSTVTAVTLTPSAATLVAGEKAKLGSHNFV